MSGLKSGNFQALQAKYHIYVTKTRGKALYDKNRQC